MHSEPLETPDPSMKPANMIIHIIVAFIFLIAFIISGFYKYQPTLDPEVVKAIRSLSAVFVLIFSFFIVILWKLHGKLPLSVKKVERSIEDLVADFESGELAKEDWHHLEHLRIVLYYLFYEPTKYRAISKMRCGLIRYGALRTPQIVCTERYHETITLFWIYEVNLFIHINEHEKKSFEELEIAMKESHLVKKDYIYKFYSQQVLDSEVARATYVEPSGMYPS